MIGQGIIGSGSARRLRLRSQFLDILPCNDSTGNLHRFPLPQMQDIRPMPPAADNVGETTMLVETMRLDS
jgi:hypothetical protein